MANPKISAVGPRLQVCVPWQKFLLFSPSCQVRGSWEVSTLWVKKALEGWRDGSRPKLGKRVSWRQGALAPLAACHDLGHAAALLGSVFGLYTTKWRWTRLHFYSHSVSTVPGALMPITPSGPRSGPGDRSVDPTLQTFVLNPRV